MVGHVQRLAQPSIIATRVACVWNDPYHARITAKAIADASGNA